MAWTPQAMYNLHNLDVYKLKRAKFWSSQNFPGTHIMFFQKKTQNVVSIPKTKKKERTVWEK